MVVLRAYIIVSRGGGWQESVRVDFFFSEPSSGWCKLIVSWTDSPGFPLYGRAI